VHCALQYTVQGSRGVKVDPPCVFLIAAGGDQKFSRGGSTPQPPRQIQPCLGGIDALGGLSGVVVMMLDVQLAVVGSNPVTAQPVIFPEVCC